MSNAQGAEERDDTLRLAEPEAELQHNERQDDTRVTEAATEARASASTVSAPWTVEEHCLFLIGAQLFGRGSWLQVSRVLLPNRSATQIASHAQKHFQRKRAETGTRRYSSLLVDIEDVLDSRDGIANPGLWQRLVPLLQAAESRRAGETLPGDGDGGTGAIVWSKAEHCLFLIGLQRFGTGRWADIAKHYCTKRTAARISSHAQKYFHRQARPFIQGSGAKQSVFDISFASLAAEHGTDDFATLERLVREQGSLAEQTARLPLLEAVRQMTRDSLLHADLTRSARPIDARPVAAASARLPAAASAAQPPLFSSLGALAVAAAASNSAKSVASAAPPPPVQGHYQPASQPASQPAANQYQRPSSASTNDSPSTSLGAWPASSLGWTTPSTAAAMPSIAGMPAPASWPFSSIVASQAGAARRSVPNSEPSVAAAAAQATAQAQAQQLAQLHAMHQQALFALMLNMSTPHATLAAPVPAPGMVTPSMHAWQAIQAMQAMSAMTQLPATYWLAPRADASEPDAKLHEREATTAKRPASQVSDAVDAMPPPKRRRAS